MFDMIGATDLFIGVCLLVALMNGHYVLAFALGVEAVCRDLI